MLISFGTGAALSLVLWTIAMSTTSALLMQLLWWPQSPGVMIAFLVWGVHGYAGRQSDALVIAVNAVVYAALILVWHFVRTRT